MTYVGKKFTKLKPRSWNADITAKMGTLMSGKPALTPATFCAKNVSTRMIQHLSDNSRIFCTILVRLTRILGESCLGKSKICTSYPPCVRRLGVAISIRAVHAGFELT